MGKNIVIPPFYKKLFWRDIIGYAAPLHLSLCTPFLARRRCVIWTNEKNDFFFLFFFFVSSLTLGTLIGGVWMWQINKTRAKRADYYKQLALANKQQQ